MPVTVIEYEYNDSSYELFEVEHELKAPSHPRDMKQWGKVIGVIALVGVVCTLTYLYLFGVPL